MSDIYNPSQTHQAVRDTVHQFGAAELENQAYNVVLLGVYKHKKEHFYFNPLDSMHLELGDYLMVIGYRDFIVEFEKHLHTKVRNG